MKAMRNGVFVLCLAVPTAAACSKKEPVDANDAYAQDVKAHEMEDEKLASDQAKERAELKGEQAKDVADTQADLEKRAADLKADRAKVEADLKTRLEKADVRIKDVEPKVAKAKAATKTKANEILTRVKEQRAALGKRVGELGAIADDRWTTEKSELEANAKTLESNLDEVEKTVTPT